MSNIGKLVIAITTPLLIGFTSGFFTITGAGTWYEKLEKPSWNPPGWLFAPVWTSLYIIMGIALFFIWKANTAIHKKNTALSLFAVQLVLNFFWSFIFFKLEEPGWALTEIFLLWVTILATIFSFAAINKLSAWLLVPYISWVTFAAILNYTIWDLNK